MDALELVRVSMWIIGTATALVAIGLGIILSYHWTKYSGSPYTAKLSILVYFGGIAGLLAAMFGAAAI
jgi:hypothetical protein